MIILDTNVLSALMRAELDVLIVAWLNDQPLRSIWTTSVNVYEIRYGLSLLPVGKRRNLLKSTFEALLDDELEGRVLPLDYRSARVAAEIAAMLRHQGRTIEKSDSQIAGIANACNATLATRNVKHFEHAGIDLVNPWD